MNDQKAKQQIVEKIKDATNILVTVSSDPSVDELSAALGLTMVLNKMEKHATAIFSGHVPPAITFLNPEKTFEDTTDSLRDFIIALDKEKADHLRYKVEDDMVKIFITPYRTTISGDDLEFSQGDYNVDLVMALGVANQDHLDAALAGHGRILHDAAVVTLSAGVQESNLGSIDWRDQNASSLSEMLVTLHEAMKLAKSLLDKPIATAFMTGIVAATERFSNERTSSRAMTVAAQLMAAGADQQLIATKLAESEDEDGDANDNGPTDTPPKDSDGTKGKEDGTMLEEGKSSKVEKGSKNDAPAPEETPAKKEAGVLNVSHELHGTVDEVAEATRAAESNKAETAAREALEAATTQGQATPVAPPQPVPAPTTQGPALPPVVPPASTPEKVEGAPSLGGTLNATSEQAEEDARREQARDTNKTILSHGTPLATQAPQFTAPLNGALEDGAMPAPVDIFSQAPSAPAVAAAMEPASAPTVEVKPVEPIAPAGAFGSGEASLDAAPAVTPPAAPTLADIDAQNRAPAPEAHADNARAAIDAAFASAAAPSTAMAAPAPLPPVPPVASGLPMPPPVPDFSAMPQADLPPDRLADIFATDPTALTPPPAPSPNDPGQFRIPGQ